MSGAAVPGRPPGPKTALRCGTAGDQFSVILGRPDSAAAEDRGAAVRRALVEEIRARAAPPARKPRRRR